MLSLLASMTCVRSWSNFFTSNFMYSFMSSSWIAFWASLLLFRRLGDNLRLCTMPRLSPTIKIGSSLLKAMWFNTPCFFDTIDWRGQDELNRRTMS